MTKAINGFKQCGKCKITKYVEDYSKNKSTSDGLQGSCKECKRAQNREYMRKRRESDPDFREAQKQVTKAWANKNREYVNRKQREYQQTLQYKTWYKEYAQTTKFKEYQRDYWKANPEKRREKEARARAKNPERERTKDANRRARIKLASEDRAVSTEYRKAIKNDSCAYCGQSLPFMHVDHFFPLAKGGTDHWYNLVRACDVCNSSKGSHCGTWFMLKETKEQRIQATTNRIQRDPSFVLDEERLCRANLHKMIPSNIASGQCKECKNDRQRERRERLRSQ